MHLSLCLLKASDYSELLTKREETMIITISKKVMSTLPVAPCQSSLTQRRLPSSSRLMLTLQTVQMPRKKWRFTPVLSSLKTSKMRTISMRPMSTQATKWILRIMACHPHLRIINPMRPMSTLVIRRDVEGFRD